jgi:hypothetical protein
VDLIRTYARKARDYEQAYRDGHKAGRKVEEAVKAYKSHRRILCHFSTDVPSTCTTGDRFGADQRKELALALQG